MKERDLQKLVMDYLAAKHILTFRMQSSFTVSEYKGKKRAFRSGVVGMADILAFRKRRAEYLQDAAIPGDYRFDIITPVWIELKAPGGKQSDFQKSFQAQVESNGHRYLLIRSLDELEAQL
jgi:hypothetical protein